MDVKEAVKKAKAYVADLLADEGLVNLGLEEIKYDETEDAWNITIGFSRPWNSVRSSATYLTGEQAVKRAYRIVKLRNSNGEVLSFQRYANED